MSALLELRAARIVLPLRPAEPPVDLRIRRAGGLALIGGSGEGKSLLCRLMLGQRPPPPLGWSGALLLDGEPTTPEALAARAGSATTWAPQGGRECLVPGWSLDRHVATLAPADAVAGVREAMQALGLSPSPTTLGADATRLSEGMTRRFLLALALSVGAELVVLDEPGAGLDPTARARLASLVRERVTEEGAALVLATHDLALAATLADRFALVRDGAPIAATDRLDRDGPLGPLVRASEEVA